MRGQGQVRPEGRGGGGQVGVNPDRVKSEGGGGQAGTRPVRSDQSLVEVKSEEGRDQAVCSPNTANATAPAR